MRAVAWLVQETGPSQEADMWEMRMGGLEGVDESKMPDGRGGSQVANLTLERKAFWRKVSGSPP